MSTHRTWKGFLGTRQLLSLVAYCLASFSGVGAMEPIPDRQPQAPPVPPPVLKSEPGPVVGHDGPVPGPGDILWSIGQPTDEEQLYLEYINRSRANPPAEGARLAATTDPDVLSAYSYFGVNLTLMQSQFNAIAAVPPLAMSAELLRAARLHSGDMFTNQFQGHTGSTGSTLGSRATAQGYNYSSLGENVYSYAESVWHGHAGFNVDWGPGTGGMQTPPGHQNNIHNGTMREAGIGVVTVDIPGSSYYAVTADSGGYAVPVITNGNYAVSFSASGLGTQKVAQVVNARNLKVDFVPAYQPPLISGPNPASVNQPHAYSISVVGAAIGYDWMSAMLASYSAVEGAESLANVTIVSSASYSVQASNWRANP